MLYQVELKGKVVHYKARIVEKVSDYVYRIEIYNNVTKTAHINQLKKSILKCPTFNERCESTTHKHKTSPVPRRPKESPEIPTKSELRYKYPKRRSQSFDHFELEDLRQANLNNKIETLRRSGRNRKQTEFYRPA